MMPVRYLRRYPSAPRTRTRKFGHGAPAQFTSETERRADGWRRRTVSWPKGATQYQTWGHRLTNMPVRQPCDPPLHSFLCSSPRVLRLLSWQSNQQVTMTLRTLPMKLLISNTQTLLKRWLEALWRDYKILKVAVPFTFRISGRWGHVFQNSMVTLTRHQSLLLVITLI